MKLWPIIAGAVITLAGLWLVLVAFLVIARPKGARLGDALRVLPDTLRLLRRLAVDKSLPRDVRVRLWSLLAYLAMPIDLIPDFIPVIGHADDVIIAILGVAVSGPTGWYGSAPASLARNRSGLAALHRIVGISE